MKHLLGIVATSLFLLISGAAEATLLISEGFEGPNTIQNWNGSTWVAIPNFVGPGFTSSPTGGTNGLAKETSGCHTGNQCARLYGEHSGGTSEFYTNEFTSHPAELWITYWEKLSPSYGIDFGHKWFLVNGGPTLFQGPYLNWQSWAGIEKNDLSSRVYTAGTWDGTGQNGFQFTSTKSTLLPLDQWFQTKIHVKLNTPGQSNGAWQVWIKKDGVNWTVLWDMQNVNNIRTADGMNNIYWLRFGGTRARAETPVQSFGTKWMDDIKVGTTEADVSGDGGGGAGGSDAAVDTTARVDTSSGRSDAAMDRVPTVNPDAAPDTGGGSAGSGGNGAGGGPGGVGGTAPQRDGSTASDAQPAPSKESGGCICSAAGQRAGLPASFVLSFLLVALYCSRRANRNRS